MSTEHLVYHIPRCAGTMIGGLLKNHCISPLRRDSVENGEIVMEVLKDGRGGVTLTQDPSSLKGADKVHIIMRCPISRAVSLYHHLEKTVDGAADSDALLVGWRKKTIDEYVNGDQLESNWVTRALSGGQFVGECTEGMYREAVLRLCSSSVYTLEQLGKMIESMGENGVEFEDEGGVARRLGEKVNASDGEVATDEQRSKLAAANVYDCRLWELAQILAERP
jgi:hypothetical protein